MPILFDVISVRSFWKRTAPGGGANLVNLRSDDVLVGVYVDVKATDLIEG